MRIFNRRLISDSITFSFLSIVAAVLIVITILSVETFAQEIENENPEKHYTFIYKPTSSIADKKNFEIVEVLERVFEEFSDQEGITLNFVNIGSAKYEDDFVKRKADFAYLGMDHVMALKLRGVHLEPIVLASISNRQSAKVCLYVNGELNDVSNLKGSTASIFGHGESATVYMGARQLMFENGIDMPLVDHFGEFLKIPHGNSEYQALLMDKLQAVLGVDLYHEMYSKSLPQIEGLSPASCTKEEYPIFGIFMRDGIDKDDVAIFKKYLKKLHKSPLLKEFRTIILALDIKLVEPDPEVWNQFDVIYKRSVEKGWIEEAMVFTEQMKKLDFGQTLKKEKKTYKECKEECKDEEEQMECVDICMGG